MGIFPWEGWAVEAVCAGLEELRPINGLCASPFLAAARPSHVPGARGCVSSTACT